MVFEKIDLRYDINKLVSISTSGLIPILQVKLLIVQFSTIVENKFFI